MMTKSFAMPVTTITLLAACALAACAHENDDTTTPTARTTSGSQMAAPVDRHAVDDLAKARCDREQTCDNVGSGKTYATRDVCMEKLHGAADNDLTNASCPNGISRQALDKCLADIRGERCDHPLDTLSRINSCARATLCP